MSQYTAGFRQKVKDDYLKGRYPTIAALARAHKITNTKLISRWRKKDSWDDEFKALEEARTTAELTAATQNDGLEITEFKEISQIHGTLWKAIIAQIATRFRKRDDGTVPQLNEGQLESLSRILLRAMEGQRKALGIDDGNLLADQSITINYPGLESMCRDPDFFTQAESTVIDAPNSEEGQPEE